MTDESQREDILVNVTPREVRAALLENGILQEVHIERAARRGLISNIYNTSVGARFRNIRNSSAPCEILFDMNNAIIKTEIKVL